jgi:hypothetical protein
VLGVGRGVVKWRESGIAMRRLKGPNCKSAGCSFLSHILINFPTYQFPFPFPSFLLPSFPASPSPISPSSSVGVEPRTSRPEPLNQHLVNRALGWDSRLAAWPLPTLQGPRFSDIGAPYGSRSYGCRSWPNSFLYFLGSCP